MKRVPSLLSLSSSRVGYVALGLSLLVGALLVVQNRNAHADSIDWVTSAPTAVKSTSSAHVGSTNHVQGCKNVNVKIGNSSNIDTACVYQAKSFRFGRVRHCTPNWYGSCNVEEWFVIGFANESKMYKVSNLGAGPDDTCWYGSSQTDVIVRSCNGALVIRDVMSNLTKTNGSTGVEYTINQPAFHSYTLDSQGTYLYMHAVAISANGRWAVMESEQYGIMRVDLLDDTIKLYSTDIPPRGYGVDPQFEFAISNDGRFVASGGGNVPTRIYDIGMSCGATASAIQSSWRGSSLSNECPYRDLSSIIYQVNGNSTVYNRSSSNMKFSDDGGELYLLAQPYSNSNGVTSAWLTFTATGYSGPAPLDYLALGDSYSSGEGDTELNPATSKKYYRNYTDMEENQSTGVPREKCHVSTRSYPYRIAQSMGLALGGDPREWGTVACSGAQMFDVNGVTPANYEGQDKGDGSHSPRLYGYSDVADLQSQALNEFIPGRVEQIEFVKKYKPKVITLTMGGNDIGFGDIMRACAWLGTCPYAEDEKAGLGRRIEAQYLNLKTLYTDLYEASGSQAKIYVIGYPQFINPGSGVSCDLNVGMLNADERALIGEGVEYMNSVIEAAAQSAGVKYVDIQDSLSGHRLCDSNTKHVTGITWLGGQESFHPNAQGNAVMASAILSQVNNESLEDYTWCGGGGDICPNGSITSAPTIPAYFGVSNSTPNSAQENMTFSEQVKNAAVHILTGLYHLAPNSTANVSIHSDPLDLGDFMVNQDGQLDQSVSLPQNLEVGYHTLIVSGQSYSGEPIVLTQTILVKGTDPDDIDDDGVLDSQDECLFITPSGIDADYDGTDDACDSEITDPILYIARNGDASKGEDSGKLYIYRNTLASSVTGISGDYVDVSQDSGNHFALVASSQDNATSGTFNKFIMLPDPNNPQTKIPTILMTKHNDQTNAEECIALQPVDFLSPALNPTDSAYIPREFTRLSQIPEGQTCDGEEGV